VGVALAASAEEPYAVTLFSVSMVNVGAGIKQFRRFCSQRNPAIGQDAVPTLQQFLNLPTLKLHRSGATTGGMVERQCRYCERSFQPSKYQQGSWYAANLRGSRSVAPIITAGKSRLTGIPPGMPGQPSEMAVPQPRLLAAVPAV